MNHITYANRQLAEDFDYVFQSTSSSEYWPAAQGGFDFRRRIRELIKSLDLDIPLFYKEHGSLKDLKVEGLTRKMIGALELILQTSVDNTIIVLNQKDQVRDIRWRTYNLRTKIKGDIDSFGSHGPTVRRLEGD